MLFDVIWCFLLPFCPISPRHAGNVRTLYHQTSSWAGNQILKNGTSTYWTGDQETGCFKKWEMMGNFENGITGTTAQRFKLCLMCAPRCLLFLPYGFVATVLTRFGVAELMCLLFRMSYKAQQDPVANPCRQRPGKSMPGDVRWCQVLGVRCHDCGLRGADQFQNDPSYRHRSVPLSASQCSGFRRGHIGFCGGGIYFALSPQAQHDSMHDEKISKGSSQLFPFIFDP